MSGKRIDKQDRKSITKGRRYVKRIREEGAATFNIDKVSREYSRIGR